MKMTGIYGGYATQTELDDQYDVERVVPNIEKYLAYYVDGSAASREALKPQMRLSYGPTVAESLNLFPAQKPGKRPIFLFFHGGWWRSNPADLFDVMALLQTWGTAARRHPVGGLGSIGEMLIEHNHGFGQGRGSNSECSFNQAHLPHDTWLQAPCLGLSFA